MNAADIAFVKILALMLVFLFALITWAACAVVGRADDQEDQMGKEDPEDDTA